MCSNSWKLKKKERLNCVLFFFPSDVDSEATEGNTENEQEDAYPSTGKTVIL